MTLKIDRIAPNIKYELQESHTTSHTKCGTIFCSNQEFVYFCIYCQKEFENAKLFESHIIQVHLNIITIGVASEEESVEEIYEFSDDIKFLDNNNKEFEDDEDTFISNLKKENSSIDEQVTFNKNNSISNDNLTDNDNTENISKSNFSKEDCTEIKECIKPKIKMVGPGPFTCKFCSKILKNQHTYRVHINLQHSGLGPFKCHICAHLMKTKLNLDKHVKRVHKNINAPIYKCNYCELGFISDSKLTLHIHKNHTFEKTFTCKVCGKTFMNMGNLKTHEHIHSGIKPFQCEICGKKFIRSNNMDVHKRRHLSDRNIKCNICNKMFYTRTSMQDHLISHTNEKKFSCDYCSTRFARKGDKLKHIQTKHPEVLSDDQKKYACNICNADFALRVSFRQHMKSQHSVTLGNLNDSTIPKD